MQPKMLFPQDLLEPNKVDEHFRPEAAAARKQGLTVLLLDHDALVAGNTNAALQKVTQTNSPLIYRGWMIPPARYEALESKLHQAGMALRTNANHYAHAHHLPEWYNTVTPWTAESKWTQSADLDELLSVLAAFETGPAVVKDYSKSEKQYWDEAMFIPDVSDTGAALAVARRFLELRGSAFDTGFVVRRFEEYQPDEYRTWWVNGQLKLVTAHPDTPDTLPDKVDFSALQSTFIELDVSPFATIDVTYTRRDNQLRVIEVGDGQVSDRPSTISPESFMAAIT